LPISGATVSAMITLSCKENSSPIFYNSLMNKSFFVLQSVWDKVENLVRNDRIVS